MRLTALAFLAFSFVIYWLWVAEPPSDQPRSLGPVFPSIFRLLPDAAKSTGRADSTDPSLRRWLIGEAAKMGTAHKIPASSVIYLKQQALSLSALELKTLAWVALDPSCPTDARSLAIYIIGLSESAHARERLQEIGQSPIPTPSSNQAYANEVLLRSEALEGLVKRLTPDESSLYLKAFLMRTSDPVLARRARYWLAHLG